MVEMSNKRCEGGSAQPSRGHLGSFFCLNAFFAVLGSWSQQLPERLRSEVWASISLPPRQRVCLFVKPFATVSVSRVTLETRVAVNPHDIDAVAARML